MRKEFNDPLEDIATPRKLFKETFRGSEIIPPESWEIWREVIAKPTSTKSRLSPVDNTHRPTKNGNYSDPSGIIAVGISRSFGVRRKLGIRWELSYLRQSSKCWNDETPSVAGDFSRKRGIQGERMIKLLRSDSAGDCELQEKRGALRVRIGLRGNSDKLPPLHETECSYTHRAEALLSLTSSGLCVWGPHPTLGSVAP